MSNPESDRFKFIRICYNNNSEFLLIISSNILNFQCLKAVQAVLWNEEKGAWFDYDLFNKKPRPYFTPTNLSPLYFGCFDKTNKAEIARKVLGYIDSTGIDAFPGGLPVNIFL